MRSGCIRVGAIAGIAVSLGVIAMLGGVLGMASTSPGPTRVATVLAEGAFSGITVSDTAGTVAQLERRVSAGASDRATLLTLGLAYQVRWRETADATFLPRSERALRKVLTSAPNDPDAVLGLGNLALIRHEFRTALRIGRRARSLAPSGARPYGVIGDALIELGRYREAFASFDRMVALKPTLASYARISYARELLGDRRGAIQAMQLALDATGGQAEPSAWASTELGKLELGSGNPVRATRHFKQALAVEPEFVGALQGLARIEAGRDRLVPAVAYARAAAERVPLPQSVGLLADLYERRGRRADARRERATVSAIERLLTANGFRLDLESAIYRADHRIEPGRTVALARSARAARPSIYGDDAVAWALTRAGRCSEARVWSNRSLRLGTSDAMLFFHRGELERCLGHRARARAWYGRALRLDDTFSVRFAPHARAYLERDA